MSLTKLLFALSVFCILYTACPAAAHAQSDNYKTVKKHKRTGSLYLSWGYNTEWYTNSTVHVDQPSLGNSYDLEHVYAHDHKGWDHALFNQQPSIPQYNYRLGYYFNKKQDMGIEGNFDHTKYIINDGEYVLIKGTMNNQPYTQTVHFAQTNGFYYYLNNGANFLLFNFVKKVEVYRNKTNKFRLDLTGKAGIGPVIPHVQDEFYGHPNQQHFQLGGWNTGLETAIRATICRYAYLEFSQKADYARYSGLKIYDGTAKQNFACYELILSAGVYLPTTKHNPMFATRATLPE